MLSQPNASIPERVKLGWLSLLVASSSVATGVGLHMAQPAVGCGILWCTGVTNAGTVLDGIGLWIFFLSAGFTVVFATMLVKRASVGQELAAGLVAGKGTPG